MHNEHLANSFGQCQNLRVFQSSSLSTYRFPDDEKETHRIISKMKPVKYIERSDIHYDNARLMASHKLST